MRSRTAVLLGAVLAELAFAAPALAAPKLVVSLSQRREVVEQTAAGRTTRWVATQDAKPGDVLEYVLAYANQGDAPAADAVVEDPIPRGTVYLASTATGDGAEITFSSDGGRTFAPPVKLTYEVRLPSGAVEKRVATPAEYTHVRWTLKTVPAGATGTVTFRVKVS
jgi:uncharacterized repeat protein (TIGR01451 family)